MANGLAYSLTGLVTFGVALWAAAGNLREASQTPTLSVEVARANVVASEGQWDGRVEPAALAPRTRLHLDGEPIEAGPIDLSTLGPGYHFVETRLERRGGRRERIVDGVLVGPFADRTGEDATCGVALSLSAPTLVDALVPTLKEMALPELRRNQFMGPATTFEQLDVELVPAGLRFSVVVAGKNRVRAQGWLMVKRRGDRHFELRLLNLSGVSFTGETREAADMTGAAVGAVIAGPVGAVAGAWLVDGYVADKARDEIERAIETGLRQASEVALFPETVELVAGRPESTVSLGFCDEIEVMPEGVTGRLAVRPVATRREQGWRVPGPVLAGVTLPSDGPVESGIRLDLSLDLANALLETWTANGLLDALLDESSLRARTNETLDRWTTLQVTDVDMGLPPVLSLEGGTEAGWGLGLADLRLGVSGVDTTEWGEVLFAGRGVVEPRWDDEHGRLALTGRVDDVSITCARARARGTRLVSCLGPLLELGDVAARLDDAVAPGREGLPSLDVRGLVSARSKGLLRLGSLEIGRPSPGILRFTGEVDVPEREP